MIEFSVLGPLELRRDGARLNVPTTMLRRLLALLLARAGTPVPIDVIVDALWPVGPPPSARRTVAVYISRLRSVLGDDDRVLTAAGAYALDPRAEELDSSEFMQLVAVASTAAARGDVVGAGQAFRDGLALWRGAAFEGMHDMPLIAAAADRLEQLRLMSFEQWVDSELASGRHAEASVALNEMIAAHPYRERLRGQRMLALYRGGRQAEALETYRETYQVLMDDLGVEPTDELNRLHQRILAGDQGLLAPEAPAPAPIAVETPTYPVPSQLPLMIREFVGRTDELRDLDAFLARSTTEPATMPIVAISGMAGVGKTALALRWAHHVVAGYPDGQLYVDLRGNAADKQVASATAVGIALRALGIKPDQVPGDLDEASSLYRSLLATRRVMIVLDNARSVDQVRRLLPGGTGCLVIVTSRHRLGELEIHDGAYGRRLDVLSAGEAGDLISELIGRERARAEPDVVVEVARLCAFLPLAVRIAAARLGEHGDQGIAWYRDELASDDRLGALSLEGDEGVAVRAAFDLSYRMIPAETQRLFRLLGLVPGPDFGVDAVAALAGVSIASARRGLARLAAVHLIRQPSNDRYDFHDLIREFAQELASTEPDRQDAYARLYRWYAYCIRAAGGATYGSHAYLPADVGDEPPFETTFDLTDPAQSIAWAQREYVGLLAAITAGVATGNARATTRIADSLRPYLQAWSSLNDWLLIADAAREAARLIGDLAAQCSADIIKASAYGTRNDYGRAKGYLTTALEFGRRAGWERGTLTALGNLAMIDGITGRLAESHASIREVIKASERLDLPNLAFVNRGNLGRLLHEMGRSEEGLAHILTGLSSSPDLYISPLKGNLLDSAGVALSRLGRYDEATDHFERALALFRHGGDPVSEAMTLAHCSGVALAQGNLDDARTFVALALIKVQNRSVERIEAEILNYAAPINVADQQPETAIRNASRAYDLAAKVGARWPEISALINLSSAHHALGDDAAARDFGRRARDLADEFGYGGLAIDAAAAIEQATISATSRPS